MKNRLNLSVVLEQYRWATKQTLRQLAPKIGVNHATLMRVEQGYEPDGDTMCRLMIWLLSESELPAERAPAHRDRKK